MALFASNRREEEEEYLPADENYYDDGFDELEAGEESEAEPDPEERLARRKDRFRLAMGAGNLVAIIGGTVAILVLLTMMISMIYFVMNDMGRSFSLFQTNF